MRNYVKMNGHFEYLSYHTECLSQKIIKHQIGYCIARVNNFHGVKYPFFMPISDHPKNFYL